MKTEAGKGKSPHIPFPPPTSTSPATRDQARETTGSCHKPGHVRLPFYTPKAPRPQKVWRPSPSHAMLSAPMLPSDIVPYLGLTLLFSFLRQMALSSLSSSLYYPQGVGS